MSLTTWKEKIQFGILLLSIISIAIALTINAYPLYVVDIDYLNILDNVSLTKEELLGNYQQLMLYLNLPWINTLHMTDFPVSASGALHFWEVKKLFLLDYAVVLITTIPSYFFVRRLWKEKRLWILTNGLKISALAPVVLGFFMFVGFDTFFVLFHQVFFNNDAWIFDAATDPIITVLPEEFFMHCFVLALVLFELIVWFLIYLGNKQIKKVR